MPQYLLNFYHTYDRNVRIPSFDVYKENFFCLVKSFDQVFLVIDALDECKQDERDKIMNFIFDTTDNLPRAKVFITSRRETDIASDFARHKTPTIQIEARNVTKDIKAYVTDRVEYLVKIKKLRLKKPSLKENIVETLVTGAEGMYVFW